MGKNNGLESKMTTIHIANLIKKGWSQTQLIPYLCEKYKINERNAKDQINRTIEWICLYDQSDFIKEVRATQVARSEYILEKAIEDRDYATANKIIDTINKTYKLYDNVQRVEFSNNTVQFKFNMADEEFKKEVTEDGEDD